jgi:Predicted transcriptional regulator
VIKLVEITDGMEQFKMCVLKLKYCNGLNPCPLHYEMEEAKKNYLNVFNKNTFGDLLKDGKSNF